MPCVRLDGRVRLESEAEHEVLAGVVVAVEVDANVGWLHLEGEGVRHDKVEAASCDALLEVAVDERVVGARCDLGEVVLAFELWDWDARKVGLVLVDHHNVASIVKADDAELACVDVVASDVAEAIKEIAWYESALWCTGVCHHLAHWESPFEVISFHCARSTGLSSTIVNSTDLCV